MIKFLYQIFFNLIFFNKSELNFIVEDMSRIIGFHFDHINNFMLI